ncbi:unnamed protein product [Microthlaspi erraticum]|uniref:Adenosylmethionine decarboxylase n=1 Tax=Microthlaspi erraticum TaxID=1685480 RepID=A0A6D2KQI7_9BRAS|nr:unnamed protein product [Microthlaspi erraticum]
MYRKALKMEGFEGVEKRLEMAFSTGARLRQKLTEEALAGILEPVECYIISSKSEEHVDAYLLSTSSCFVHDDRIIVKTCGKTTIFKCMAGIIRTASPQVVTSVLYTRGEFIWPEKQPSPHKSLADENAHLKELVKSIPGLKVMDPLVTGNENMWHVLGAFSTAEVKAEEDVVTVEMSMKGLDTEKASVFFKKTSSNMTEASGVKCIFPGAKLDAYDFEPCGYSMNGVEGKAVSTIHVAPEVGSSFASFEVFGYDFKRGKKFNEVVTQVLATFKPKKFTLTIHSTTVRLNGNEPEFLLDLGGYTCSEKKVKHLGHGSIIYYCF